MHIRGVIRSITSAIPVLFWPSRVVSLIGFRASVNSIWNAVPLQLVVFTLVNVPSACVFGEQAPSESQIRSAHSQLRNWVATSEGTIIRRRQEEPLNHLRKGLNGADKVPLSFKGDFWVSGAIFRSTGSRFFDKDDGVNSGLESLATDGDQFYRFTSSDSQRGSLFVYPTPSLDSPKLDIDCDFLWIINSLWSYRGSPLTNVFQRPETTTEVADYEGIQAAIIVRTKPDAATEVTHILDPRFEFARRFEVATVRHGDRTTQICQIIVPTRKSDGRIVPSRVVEIVDDGSGWGYTAVTDLEFLTSTTSSLPQQISVETFEDLGLEFQVYHASADGGPDILGPRLLASQPRSNEPTQSGNMRLRVLVVATVVAILFVFLFTYLIRRLGIFPK